MAVWIVHFLKTIPWHNLIFSISIHPLNNNNNNTQNYTSYSICCTPLPGADPKSFYNAMQLALQDCFGTYFLQLDGPFRPFDIIWSWYGNCCFRNTSTLHILGTPSTHPWLDVVSWPIAWNYPCSNFCLCLPIPWPYCGPLALQIQCPVSH